MFLPKLRVLPIDPEENVKFIIGYLEKEGSGNTTRPFFEKTVKLYPELKDINDTRDEVEKVARVRDAVMARLDGNRAEIEERIKYFQEKFDSFISKFIEAQCKLFNYEWSESNPEILCFVGYLPFYPRSTKDKCFYVSYQDEERVFSGAVHEINHMIFFEKWNEMHGGNLEEKLWPDPLWFLEEIIVDPTLNDPSVKKYTLYENKAYPQFYEKDEETGMSIMDLVKGCYERKESIEGFLEEAYGVVEGYCKRNS